MCGASIPQSSLERHHMGGRLYEDLSVKCLHTKWEPRVQSHWTGHAEVWSPWRDILRPRTQSLTLCQNT